MRFKRSILIAAIASVAAVGTIAITGSVVIFDPYREIASAEVINGLGRKQPLRNLAFMRLAIPRVEGAVRLTCKSGRVVERGYVTPSASSWHRVGEVDCKLS